eukprot:1150410-Pelagomonas_calceolata.AAC.2
MMQMNADLVRKEVLSAGAKCSDPHRGVHSSYRSSLHTGKLSKLGRLQTCHAEPFRNSWTFPGVQCQPGSASSHAFSSNPLTCILPGYPTCVENSKGATPMYAPVRPSSAPETFSLLLPLTAIRLPLTLGVTPYTVGKRAGATDRWTCRRLQQPSMHTNYTKQNI